MSRGSNQVAACDNGTRKQCCCCVELAGAQVILRVHFQTHVSVSAVPLLLESYHACGHKRLALHYVFALTCTPVVLLVVKCFDSCVRSMVSMGARVAWHSICL